MQQATKAAEKALRALHKAQKAEAKAGTRVNDEEAWSALREHLRPGSLPVSGLVRTEQAET